MIHVSRDSAFTACSSDQFADQVARASPFPSTDALLAAARRIWWNDVGVQGWLDAFAAHPRIGDAAALQKKYAGQAFGALSQGEQAAALASGDASVFEELARLNAQYEARYGHIFIICAAGLSAQQMLQAIRGRVTQAPLDELTAAAREQMKITEQRLLKLITSPQPGTAAGPTSCSGDHTTSSRAAVRTGQLADHLSAASSSPPPQQQQQQLQPPQQQQQQARHGPLRSPITTHVLDTALGCPAAGLPITLQRLMDGSNDVWDTVAVGVTDSDGRISNLLPPGDYVAPGNYRMAFETGEYLRGCHARHPGVFSAVPFYPVALVTFAVTPDTARQHFHIPLSLSPYAYSTYRGS